MNGFISPLVSPEKIAPDSYWFIFYRDQIILKSVNNKHSIPGFHDYSIFEKDITEKYFVGNYKGVDCYVSFISKSVDSENYETVRLRKAFYTLEENEFWLAGRAFQTVYFHHHHLYCGVCGSPTKINGNEFARSCTVCKELFYPQQAPAVIMAVIRDDKILLARSKRFPTKMYSVLAGFVEPGESLEECVKREVREECGIDIKNIKYFSSQPWPFPNSLMIGFTSEWESGEIKIDEKEIIEAGWFARDCLPEIPDKVSIARKLIDWFVEQK